MARPWLSESMKVVRPVFAQIAGTSIFVNLLGIAAPVFALQVYDRVIMHAGMSTLYGLLIGMAIVERFFERRIAEPLAASAASTTCCDT